MLFASLAHAQELPANPLSEPSAFSGILPILLMIVLFYFLLIRPQQKKISDHKKMVEALSRGDKVITSGGIHGVISKIEDGSLQVEIATDVTVTVNKSMVTAVESRTESADKTDKKPKVK